MQIEILNIFDAIQYMVYVYKVTAGRTMQIDEMTITTFSSFRSVFMYNIKYVFK